VSRKTTGHMTLILSTVRRVVRGVGSSLAKRWTSFPPQSVRCFSAPPQFTGSSSSEAYAFVYTCMKCETRSAKRIAKRAYHEGVVIVKCGGCGNLHLVADNLRWFGDSAENVESILKTRGEEIVKGLVDVEQSQ
jgi:hypothetical protein